MLRQLLITSLVQFVHLIRPAPSASARRANRLAFRATIKSLRRELRQISGHGLRLLIRRNHGCTPLNPREITSVLICRVNGRLGNTLLLTPLIKRIHELLPHANIDLALAYPKAVALFQGVPGIRRVILFPHRNPNAAWLYLRAVRRLRSCRYDLAIDPTPDSSSGRVAVTLSRSRYRLGFDTISQWVPLTHAVVLPDEAMHDGIRPVFLLSQALGAPFEPDDVRLWLPLLEHELEAGRTAVAEAVRCADPPRAAAPLFGFFASAAGTKTLERTWWLEFWQRFLALEPGAVALEFLAQPDATRTDSQFPALHVPSQRGLAAAISATRMFICPDTGPMHLASTTSVPTVALFRGSEISRYRPMKPSDLTIDTATCSPLAVAERCSRIWRAQA